MTYNGKIILALGAASLLALGIAGVARAQSAGTISAALAEGSVGEQDDGYLGFREAPSPALKAEVDALNIKRRAAYTQKAAAAGSSVSDMAAATACQTLTNVGQGRAYRIKGVWNVRGSAPVPRPDYCPSV